MPDRPHAAAVSERLMNGKIEASIDRLELRAVERATPCRNGGAPARRATPRRAVGTLLKEQELHAAVGGCFKRSLPARCGSAVSPRLLAPACDRLRLVPGLCLVEPRRRRRK